MFASGLIEMGDNMSMTDSQMVHIQEQLRKKYGEDLKSAFPYSDVEGNLLYKKCYDVYNMLEGEPERWILEEYVLEEPKNFLLQGGMLTGTIWSWRRLH